MIRVGLAWLITLALSGCQDGAAPTDPPTQQATAAKAAHDDVLHVQVLYRERIALPATSVVSVVLEDGAKMDVAAERIAERTVPATKGPPYAVDLEYERSKLNARGRYGLRARIENGGTLLFVSDQFVPAFGTDGQIGAVANDPIQIVVKRVPKSNDSTARSSLTGTEWVLVELRGNPAGEGAGGKRPTLTLQGSESQASGFAGCNRFTGGYELGKSGALKFSALAMTMMACPDGMELEKAFSEALRDTTFFAIEGDTLTLEAADGTVVAKLSGAHQ